MAVLHIVGALVEEPAYGRAGLMAWRVCVCVAGHTKGGSATVEELSGGGGLVVQKEQGGRGRLPVHLQTAHRLAR